MLSPLANKHPCHRGALLSVILPLLQHCLCYALTRFSSNAGRANFPWQRTALTHWESGPIPLEPQNNAWRLVTHTFNDYPAGVRRAIIVLKGKDHRVWAGWYGAKFAAPELHFGGSRWSDGAEPLKGST